MFKISRYDFQCEIITFLNSFSRYFQHREIARIDHFSLEMKRFLLKSSISFEILVEFCVVLSYIANFISDLSERAFISNEKRSTLTLLPC